MDTRIREVFLCQDWNSALREYKPEESPHVPGVNVSDMHMVYFANDMHFRLIDMGQKKMERDYYTQQGRREWDVIPTIHATFFCGLIIVLDPSKDDKSKWIRLADHVARRR
jgi:hypothetical protein